MSLSMSIALVCSIFLGSALSVDLFCDGVCQVPQENTGEGTQLLKFRCGCFDKARNGDDNNDNNVDDLALTATPEVTRKGHTPPPPPAPQSTTPEPTTTTDICHYLCSIQMGGLACYCSESALPGK